MERGRSRDAQHETRSRQGFLSFQTSFLKSIARLHFEVFIVIFHALLLQGTILYPLIFIKQLTTKGCLYQLKSNLSKIVNVDDN